MIQYMINVGLLLMSVILNISCVNSTHSGIVKNADSIVFESAKDQMMFSEPEGIKELDLFSECSNYDNNLSTVASEIRFIPLAVEPSISDFHVMDIELSNDYIFLLEMYSVFQFDRNGKFVKNIGSRGMGPEEFIQLSPPLQLDRKKELIYVLDVARNKIISYEFNGHIHRRISVPAESGCFGIIDSTVIALRQMCFERFIPNTQSIRFINYKGKNLKLYPSYIYPVSKDKRKHFGPETSFMWENNGELYSLEYGADTIFKIQKDSLIPSCVLRGKLKLDKEELFVDNIGDKCSIRSFISRPNCGIFESDNFILFRMLNEKERFIMVYNKMTKQFFRTYDKNAPLLRNSVLLTDYFTDDIVSGLSFNPQYQSQGWAIALIPAIDIDEKRNEILRFIAEHPSEESDNLKKIVQNITEMDNSVLMLVKFK